MQRGFSEPSAFYTGLGLGTWACSQGFPCSLIVVRIISLPIHRYFSSEYIMVPYLPHLLSSDISLRSPFTLYLSNPPPWCVLTLDALSAHLLLGHWSHLVSWELAQPPTPWPGDCWASTLNVPLQDAAQVTQWGACAGAGRGQAGVSRTSAGEHIFAGPPPSLLWLPPALPSRPWELFLTCLWVFFFHLPFQSNYLAYSWVFTGQPNG